MSQNNYEEIRKIIKNGILLESPITIQEKMLELSKIHDVEAIKFYI